MLSPLMLLRRRGAHPERRAEPLPDLEPPLPPRLPLSTSRGLHCVGAASLRGRRRQGPARAVSSPALGPVARLGSELAPRRNRPLRGGERVRRRAFRLLEDKTTFSSSNPTLKKSEKTMAMRGVDFKWYDGFFLSMLATSVIIVSINWKRYRLCAHPLHIWIVVDYTTVFIFRLLMFLDNGLAAGMGLDLGWQQRYARFCGRIVVLSVLVLLLYPFLWVWTVIGTLWFSTARGCLPEEGQKWGFLIWLLFSYCGLACIACVAVGKWLNRRHALQQRAQQGIPVSEYGVLVDMIRVPDWAFEAVGLEMRVGQDTAYHPGLYLTAAQREAVEALIQELPKFRLKAVPTDCSECPICLEEFHVGNEVRGLPCAHNFHAECIDQWLRLNVKCPRCRCSVFPNLDLSALNNLRSTSEPDHPSASASDVTTATAATRYVRSQPAGQSYLVRLQGLLLRPVRHETMESGDEPAVASSSSVGPEEMPSIVVDGGHQLPDR